MTYLFSRKSAKKEKYLTRPHTTLEINQDECLVETANCL